MLAALHQILAGEIYVPAALLAAVQSIEGPAPADSVTARGTDHGLTDRQLEVLGLLGQGLSNKAIARRLDISEGTVKLHMSAIFRILEVGNRTEAVTVAQRAGLFDESRAT